MSGLQTIRADPLTWSITFHTFMTVNGCMTAGFYIPYIANFLYEHPGLVPLQTKGIWVTDPLISWDIVNEYIPAYNFAQVGRDI